MKLKLGINAIFDESYIAKLLFGMMKIQEFVEDIENIQLNNAKLHILKDNNLIKTKYMIEFEDKESNYLIYAPFTNQMIMKII